MAGNTPLPGRHDARFHFNTPSVETGNEGQRNRKLNRFPLAAWTVCWQIARCKETSGKRPKETKFVRANFSMYFVFQNPRMKESRGSGTTLKNRSKKRILVPGGVQPIIRPASRTHGENQSADASAPVAKPRRKCFQAACPAVKSSRARARIFCIITSGKRS